ncbi:hypothetical protein ERX35_007810 [Macrococcus equipercicus]|uniref:PWI domain-containing protein n=1 Tax=Macrococcus equipercicus TaxID=69967 RepID=A0ABQ6R7N9_9STAP|nr:hypothetical protein [Macrococcus equipercicus]KAA1039112.1 hypothetical protein ERX35_007810 [Macrococcus equipercicus]
MWSLLIKEIDRQSVIVKGGLNMLVDDNYSATIITDEQHARQIDKLEIVEGEIKVKDGIELTPLDVLNEIKVN